MKFIILGAGAIGCYVGGRLAAAGQHVSLVGRLRIVESLSTQGMRVSDQGGFDATVASADLHLATSLADAMRPLGRALNDPLVLLVCAKATGTIAVAAEIARACPAGTVVVSLQNGVENAARLQAGAPTCEVLAGMVPFTVNWRDAHHVYQANTGSLQIQRSAQSEAFAPALRAAGVGAELHDDMQGILWGKLLLNLLNPINALANLPIRTQLLQRDHRRVFAAFARRGIGRVARRWRPARQGGRRRAAGNSQGVAPARLAVHPRGQGHAQDRTNGAHLDVRRPAKRPTDRDRRSVRRRAAAGRETWRAGAAEPETT